MDLPPEVMQVSMRVNQRYFALRNPDGSAAPFFAFAANIEATDGGAVIIAGNERVLRARFSDARHFWDLDRKTPLDAFVAKLDQVTFHAKLGSQGERVARIAELAEFVAAIIGADPATAKLAATLAKADLLTGMVGEFPELQGVMGGYYARPVSGDEVADAIRDHYAPKGPGDAVPTEPVSITVALADKMDQLTSFFGVGEKPSGSGDPYALRRAALGVIRIIRENELRLNLTCLIEAARQNLKTPAIAAEVVEFIIDRLRVQLRAEGARHDVLTAVFAAGADDDIVRLLARTEAVATLLGTEDGANLLAAYRRAANILRIEEKKDGPHDAVLETGLLTAPEEIVVADVLESIASKINADLAAEDYAAAMSAMARLRVPLDAFFDKVTVNDPEPKLRLNRLRLLSRVRATMDRIADFSKIEG
jgi:glycyl-tRNA synthetase beta chain